MTLVFKHNVKKFVNVKDYNTSYINLFYKCIQILII